MLSHEFEFLENPKRLAPQHSASEDGIDAVDFDDGKDVSVLPTLGKCNSPYRTIDLMVGVGQIAKQSAWTTNFGTQ